MDTVQDADLTPSGGVKPYAKLLGSDGNIFSLLGIATRALKSSGLRKDASDLATEVFGSTSYDEAMHIILKYVKDESEADNVDYDEDEDEDW